MSGDSASRRRKEPAQSRRTPMFEVRHDPLPPPPRPIQKIPDPFDDLPEARPRVNRHPLPISHAADTARVRPAGAPARAVKAAPPEPPPIEEPRRSLASDFADLRLASDRLHQRSFDGGPPRFELPLPIPGRGLGLLLIAALCGAFFVWQLASAPPRMIISPFNGPFAGIGNSMEGALQAGEAIAVNVPPGENPVVGAPSISADVIDAVLAAYGSPAQGTGKVWFELGKHYGIDPAYALAFFIHESSAGTNSGWAGLKPGGGSTHNVGNIICAGYPTCFGRFRDYGSWEEGIEDWYKLIKREYIEGRGVMTVEQIIPIYAPASDNNNVPNYVQTVVDLVNGWRQGVIQ
jgi:hypothetical protein